MSSNLYATPEQDKEHADHKFGANDAVPTQQRHCTDVFFLCVLFAFWGGVAAMIAMSVNSAGGLLGINRVLHGTQIDGKVCGAVRCGAVGFARCALWAVCAVCAVCAMCCVCCVLCTVCCARFEPCAVCLLYANTGTYSPSVSLPPFH